MSIIDCNDQATPNPVLLRQLAAAHDLADAVVEMTRRGMAINVERNGAELVAPTIELDLDAWLTMWVQVQAWRRLEPVPLEGSNGLAEVRLP